MGRPVFRSVSYPSPGGNAGKGLSNGLSDRSTSFEAGSKTSCIDRKLDEFDNRLSGLGVVGRLVDGDFAVFGGEVPDKFNDCSG